MNPINLLKKADKKGVYYPNEIATSFIKEGYGAKKTSLMINKFYNDDVIDYGKINKINKKISKQQKKIENPTTGILEKQYYATTSFISYSIVEKVVDDSDKRQKAIWLPSESDNPSLDHIDNYYEEFYLDEGIDNELPAQRPNCKCGFKLI